MKKLIWTVWIIVILVLSNLVCLYFLLTRSCPIQQLTDIKSVHPGLPVANFRHPIDESSAITNVAQFRKSLSLNSDGVVYDSAVIRRYLDSTFTTIKSRIDSGSHPDYDWKVGFYWMLTKDSVTGDSKLAFCVLPIMVNRNTGAIADYFSDSLRHFYRHPKYLSSLTHGGTALDAEPGNAYDEGQLWP